MWQARARKPILIVGAVAAGLAAVPVTMRLAQAASWRVSEQDRPYVDRALGEAVAIFNSTPERYRRYTAPNVYRRPGRTCVALMSVLHNDGGSYSACYDDRSGEIVEERAVICSFGGTPLSDRLRKILLGV